MKILSESNGNLLIGMLTMQENESGIYIEIDEKEVPKKIIDATKKLGGYGVKSGEWFRSNTSGTTLGKYFKLANNRVKFDVKNHDTIEKINNTNSFEEGITLLKNGLEREDLEFRLKCKQYENIECKFMLKIKNDDYITLKHSLENHESFNKMKEYFFGRDVAQINLNIEIDLSDLEKLEEVINTKKKYGEKDILDIINENIFINILI
jgi:hypothetical protein